MWLAGVERIEGQSAGAMSSTGGRKLLLHSTEGTTIEGAVAAYRARNVWPHITVDCPERRVVEHLPLEVAGRSLRNEPGGVETNRAGAVLVQIEMVGFAGTPESIGSSADLDWFGREVVAPIAALTGIPLTTGVRWVAYPSSYGEGAAQRVPAALWAGLSGLVGHQHAPENDHGDPGALDVDRILDAANDPLEDDTVKLDDEDRAWFRKQFGLQHGAIVTGNQNGLANATQPGWGHMAQNPTGLNDLRALILAADADVDEAALVAALVPPIVGAVVAALPDEVTDHVSFEDVERAVVSGLGKVRLTPAAD